jgi:glycosyltransferase involved in cell wall biosynthesis
MQPLAHAPRLLILITKTNFGGAQRYVYELAVAMRDRGYIVAVAGGGSGDLIDKLKAADIPTYTIAGAQRDFSFQKELIAIRSLYRLIRDFKPDIVHTNSSKLGGLGSLVARLLGVPRIIFTAHGWPFLEPRPLWWRALAWLGSYATTLLSHRVILVSQNDLRRTAMPGVTHKLSVIHTAVAPFITLSRDAARTALVGESVASLHAHNVWVGTIGELNHNKNHTTAIDAIAEFNTTHQSKALLIIISDGELRSTLEEQVALKGQREYVYFVGHKAEARQYLTAFDIFILPSLKEGLPYALLEAGAIGLPCIGSFVGGIPEVIENLKTGILIDPHNHETIVAALDHLINEPDARFHYGNALKQHINNRFALPEMIEHTAKLYEG